MTEPTIGERIAHIRRRRSLTQEELAERAGMSLALIHKAEQGRGEPRVSTLHAIARALDVSTAQLFGSGSEEKSGSKIDLLATRRILVPSLGTDGFPEPPPLDDLKREVLEVTRLYHKGRLTSSISVLPGIVKSAAAAVEVAENEERDRAIRLLSHAYLMLSSVLIQLRQEDLAYEAAKRSMSEAERIGDDVLRAAGADYLGWILQRQARFDEAERTVIHVGEQIEPSLSKASDVQLSVWGRLMTRGASSAARNNRPGAATDYLNMASSVATRLGDDYMTYETYWSSFGKTTVASIEVENAMTMGDAERALRLAQRVTFAERVRSTTWTRHLLTVAEARTATKDFDGAVKTLGQVRRTSPEWLRNQKLAKNVVSDLLDSASVRRARQSGLADLASFIGVQP